MKINVHGTPDFQFTAINPENGYSFSVGASKSIGGDESGFRPMQVMLASLATCSGIDVVNILKKSRVEFNDINVEVEGNREKDAVPAPFKKIRLLFRVHGKNVDLGKVEKAVKLSVEKYCSAMASLDPKIQIETVAEVAE